MRKPNVNKILLATTLVLVIVIIAVIAQSIIRTRQALALETELAEIYVLAETDYEAARDQYIALLPDVWATQEGEREALLNVEFVKILACRPGGGDPDNPSDEG